MEQLVLNDILNRNDMVKTIKNILINFEENKTTLTLKRGIYLYGNPGCGKTEFILNIIKELDYDIIKYDAGDIRNKSIIDTIAKHNMGDKNIISLFYQKAKPITIVMDEIDGMNSGDKGGINSLIKLIRPKKTKKQLSEEITYNPIICISNYHVDKKIKELMKVCHTFELKTPTNEQILYIIEKTMPNLSGTLLKNIVEFIQGDLRKLSSIYNIYKNHYSILCNEIVQNIFKPKSYNEDTKKITQRLFEQSFQLNDHLMVMNETDRTIVGLLWHENVIDVLNKYDQVEMIPFYNEILNNICFADYIDRITFQKQIWQFNEMSSLIKTFYNNYLCHQKFNNKPHRINEVRFTKVLTKYSTEYNNSLFIQNLCQQLGLDKKDLFSFFLELKNNYEENEIYELLENFDIGKLDINRIYRYLSKYTTRNTEDDNGEEIS
jgi:DNA polymerase III delta prime subunit